jgi:dTDP-4-dehydrorhamnose 3,5-epimerase
VLEISKTKLEGVLLLTPKRHGDARGYFCETWNKTRMAELGLDYDFVQDNQSLSAEVGTVRGLHFQSPPHAQAKLVRCGRGAFLDVVVDIRKGSPTYGQWLSEELSAENGRQLLIPEGFLHGFITLKPDTEILYKCNDYYSPECDGAVRFDDPEIGVDWGCDISGATLSAKDASAQSFADFNSPFEWKKS